MNTRFGTTVFLPENRINNDQKDFKKNQSKNSIQKQTKVNTKNQRNSRCKSIYFMLHLTYWAKQGLSPPWPPLAPVPPMFFLIHHTFFRLSQVAEIGGDRGDTIVFYQKIQQKNEKILSPPLYFWGGHGGDMGGHLVFCMEIHITIKTTQ